MQQERYKQEIQRQVCEGSKDKKEETKYEGRKNGQVWEARKEERMMKRRNEGKENKKIGQLWEERGKEDEQKRHG